MLIVLLLLNASVMFGILTMMQRSRSTNTYDRAREWVRTIRSESLRQLFISHRGENPDAPPNTLAAFKLALNRGAHGLELDLHLSKDNQIVLIHDEIVDTTTYDRGRVSSFTAAELKELKIRSNEIGNNR
ncbi:hypothetical protein GJ496_004102 [Pomphorhynchus laevis]|nr:hypothetical protein GJ496_004102 [Pomphorhynchus laevis]